jgi:hypothetical protein
MAKLASKLYNMKKVMIDRLAGSVTWGTFIASSREWSLSSTQASEPGVCMPWYLAPSDGS